MAETTTETTRPTPRAPRASPRVGRVFTSAAPREIDRPGAATGRRKQAIARVRIVPGTGQWTVNGRALDQYFPNKVHQQVGQRALRHPASSRTASTSSPASTAAASPARPARCASAIARALNEIDVEGNRPPLKRAGFLPVTPRQGAQEVRSEEGPQGAPVQQALTVAASACPTEVVEAFGTDGVRGLANRDLTAELALDLSVAAAHVLGDVGAFEGHRPVAVVGRDPGLRGVPRRGGRRRPGEAPASTCCEPACRADPRRRLPDRQASAPTWAWSSRPATTRCPTTGMKFLARGGHKLADDARGRDREAPPRGVGAPGGAASAGSRQDDAGQRVRRPPAVDASQRPRRLRGGVDCAHGAAYDLAPRRCGGRRRGGDHRRPSRTASTSTTATARPTSTRCRPPCSSTAPTPASPSTATPTAASPSTAPATRSTATRSSRSWRSPCARPAGSRRRRRDDRDVEPRLPAGDARARAAVVQTAVGDRYVLEAMKDGGYTLGGEQSGHVIMLDHATTGDGTLTALHLLARMADAGRAGRAGLGDDPLPQVLVNVAGSTSRGPTTASRWKAVAEAEAALGDTGRVLLRPSGTETWCGSWSRRRPSGARTSRSAGRRCARPAQPLMEPGPPLEFEGVAKSFGPVRAVDDLTFAVRPGAVTGFLGPNGAGKTTTLRMLLGLTRPTSGRPGRWPRLHRAPDSRPGVGAAWRPRPSTRAGPGPATSRRTPPRSACPGGAPRPDRAGRAGRGRGPPGRGYSMACGSGSASRPRCSATRRPRARRARQRTRPRGHRLAATPAARLRRLGPHRAHLQPRAREVQHTVDHVVIIADGQLVHASPLSALADLAEPETYVESPDPGALPGSRPTGTGPRATAPAWSYRDRAAEAGQRRTRAASGLHHQLASRGVGLEDVFLRLTRWPRGGR